MLALFLAIQVWVWLRYAGAFWISNSPGLLWHLFKSVQPLKISLEGVLFFLGPALIASFVVQKYLPAGIRVVSFSALGVLCSTLYLLYMSRLNLVFVERQLGVDLVAGGLAGFTFGAILGLERGSIDPPGEVAANLAGRRKLLGSLGLFTGVAALLGSLEGPLYFWLNRHSYIDVNVDHLGEGELIKVILANKPVWILKRSPDEIELLNRENRQLRDPRSEFSHQPEQVKNSLRSIRPEYFVFYPICTHLGCALDFKPDGRAGGVPSSSPYPQFFCPCHNGVFDLAGRAYKGTPPPVNLVVPPHAFVSEKVVRLYFPSFAEAWGA